MLKAEKDTALVKMAGDSNFLRTYLQIYCEILKEFDKERMVSILKLLKVYYDTKLVIFYKEIANKKKQTLTQS